MFKNKEQQFDFYWKEIFNGLAYNPIEFNTYRFDQTMSLPGKVNKLYDMFKVLAMNNQEVMDYLKEFVETFDEKLYGTVDDILNEWLENDKLAKFMRDLINEEVIEARTDYLGKKYVDLKERLDSEKADIVEVTAQLTHKTDKGNVSVNDINKNLGKLDQTFMTDEFLQQIIGDAPINAVPADWSITTNKLAFTPLIGQASKNLFDKSAITPSTYLNEHTGAIFSQENWFASEFIRVLSNTQYSLAPVQTLTRVAFYNSNKEYISKIDNTSTFTTPSDAVYVKIGARNSQLNTLQLERGASPTTYEPFGTTLKVDTVKNRSIDGIKLKEKSITKTELSFSPLDGVLSKNIFNKETVENDKYVNENTGGTFELKGYFTSEFIGVVPSTDYFLTASSVYRRIAFYDSNKSYITHSSNTNAFTTPSNAGFIRFASANGDLKDAQIELGDTYTGYEPYGAKVSLESLRDVAVKPKVIYTLNDAWVEWLKGSKFPVAFSGDSTVDGVGTSSSVEHLEVGTVDNKNPNAFPLLLENLLKTATNNNNLRIYNAGHSGMHTKWALDNFEAEWGDSSVYSDVKMCGIGYGINDRMRYQDEKAYREGFKSNVIEMINLFYKKGIQPFLITTQAIAEAGVKTSDVANYPLRTAEAINNVANEVKRELAKEYGLEIIDVHEFTTKFMKYSKWSIYEIISDFLHFGNVGHKYEADMFFAHINPRVEWIKGTYQLDYSSQKVITNVPSDKLTIPYPLTDNFKILANYTKEDSVDNKIMDFWIFNDANKQLTIKAHKSDLTSVTYVKVGGVNKSLSELETSLGLYDVGLYHLEVFSGASTKVDFKGFTFE